MPILNLTANSKKFTSGLKSWKLLGALVALAALSTIFSLDILSAGFLLVVYVVTLPARSMGLISRAVIFMVLAVSMNTLIGLFTWALKIPFTVSPGLWLYVLGAALIVLLSRTNPVRLPKLFPREDICSLIAAVVCIGVLLFPYASGTSTTSLVRSVSDGVDNVAHLYLIRQVETHHNYLDGYQPAINHAFVINISAYPQGFHLNAALADQLIKPVKGSHTLRQSIILFIIVTVTFYSMLVYLFVYCGLYLSKKVAKRHRINLRMAFLAILVACSLFLSILIGLYIEGFQPEIASFALFLGLIIMLLLYRDRQSYKEKCFYAVAALLICIGISSTYFYLLPVALAGTVLILLYDILHKNFEARIGTTIALVFLTVLSLIPVLLYLVYFHQAHKLDDQGGAVVLNSVLLLATFAITVAYLASRRIKYRGTNVLQLLLWLSLFFSIAVYLYQKIMVGGDPRYYFYKATYVVAILAGLAITPLLVDLATTLKTRWQTILGCIGLLCFFWVAHSAYLTLYLKRQTYDFTPQYAALLVNMASSQTYLNESPKIISIGNNCVNADDERFMRFLTAISGKGNEQQEQIGENGFWSYDRPLVYREIKDYQLTQPDKKLIIVTTDPIIQSTIITNAGVNAKYLQFIDPYAGVAKPQVGCPDFN